MAKYSGSVWADDELERIRELLKQNLDASRIRLWRLVCEHFDWRVLNGKLKEMSCRVVIRSRLGSARCGSSNSSCAVGRPPPACCGRSSITAT